MKKIINWSFGAFFRTIGRIFAYLLVGVLIMLIGAKFGLKLFLMPVKAEMLSNWAEGLPVVNRVQMYECQTSNKCYIKPVDMQGLTTETQVRNFGVSQNALTIDSGGIAIQTNSNVLKPGYLYLTNYYICANKSLNNVSPEIYNTEYDTPGVKKTSYNNASYMSLSSVPGNGDQDFTSCKQYSGLYVPSAENNWTTLRLKQSSSSTGWYISLIAVENKELGIYTDSIKSIIENSGFATAKSVEEVKQATDKIQEETKKTNDTLNDDDTTEADSKISGFFDDFNDNSHGLSSIVTAPLNAVNAMLTTTCTAPTATYKNSTFSFPCGSILWEQEGASALKTFINLIYGGLICYGIVKSLFKDVNDLKNPENDKVEVMNL